MVPYPIQQNSTGLGWFLGLCCCLFLLFGSTTAVYAQASDIAALTPHGYWRPLATNIQSVQITGPTSAHIIVGNGEDYIDAPQPECFATKNVHNWIIVQRVHPYNQPESVCSGVGIRIAVADLSQVVTHNCGLVKISGNVSAGRLQIENDSDEPVVFDHLSGHIENLNLAGSGEVDLSGFYDIHQIWLKGFARLNLFWVQSPMLLIRTEDHSQLVISGRVDELYTETWDDSIIDARFLRARIVHSRSFDSSKTYVWPIKELYGDAQNHSNIYYFKRPELDAPYRLLSGNVLSMVHIPGALLEFQPHQ